MFFFLWMLMGGAYLVDCQAINQSECRDWGESSEVRVLEGEVCWLSCPRLTPPSTHSVSWYHQQQPVTLSSRLTTDRGRLWLQPAVISDGGNYICVLRNDSSCGKISVHLTVTQRHNVVPGKDCRLPVAAATTQAIIPLQKSDTLECPDLQEVSMVSESLPNVTWYKHCRPYPFGNSDRQQRGHSLHFYNMVVSYQGVYVCTVNYSKDGRTLSFTRSIDLIAVYPPWLPKEPSIQFPAQGHVSTVRVGAKVRLLCQGLFPFILQKPWKDIWWTVDGQTLENLKEHQRFSQNVSQVKNNFQDLTLENVLLIQDFLPADLNREFNCSVKNQCGFETRRVHLQEEVVLPSVELACALSLVLLLLFSIFIVYHFLWLEILLLHRSWFGTDETHTDQKDFDVYVSYERNSEEETFVLFTLRRVLENELGYTVCIFDRDSLPGGTITDDTLSFVSRSRRLLVVLSAHYGRRGSQTLLELQAGIQAMAQGGSLRVILVQHRQERPTLRELRRARLALVLLRWKGAESEPLSSRFWKRLRVELPVKKGGAKMHHTERKSGKDETEEETLQCLSHSDSSFLSA